MVNSAQMIITRWGDAEAVSLSSPELPGIVAAFDDDPSPEEIMKTAVAAGLDPDGELNVNLEFAFPTDDVTYFVRMRHDFHADDRIAMCQRISNQVLNDEGLREYAEVDRFGDAVLIAALPSDSIRAALATAAPGEPVTLSSVDPASKRVMCVVIVLGRRPLQTEDSGPKLSDMGLTLDSTVGELLALAVERRELVHA